MKTVKIIVVGAGSRGRAYSNYATQNPDKMQIVGVAEPNDFYRNQMVEKYAISSTNVFCDWRDMALRQKFADAVIISTQDNMHELPAVSLANKGYHILLEKPMATNKKSCRNIVDAVIKNNIIFSVCHVLRYTNYTQTIKKLINLGTIGDIVSIQHLEPVGYWHFAHSFVRGHWSKQKESSFILLAKSCHDIDWIIYIMNAKCISVSSFGNLKHFKKDNRPINASDRCMDCNFEPRCSYSAKKHYLRKALKGDFSWPVDVIVQNQTTKDVENALRNGPYGRCVYNCDNDVLDHQVVNMLFDNGSTAVFTMTAFDNSKDRGTKIFGTKGSLYGDGSTIILNDFLTDQITEIKTEFSDGTILTGHGGGDNELIKSFVEAVANNDQTKVLSGPDQTLESHLAVFAAEEARLNNQVMHLR